MSRAPEEREIITVPYLNPLVLRKELENMFENDGITTLQFPEVVQEKSIIFWNLVSGWNMKYAASTSSLLVMTTVVQKIWQNVVARMLHQRAVFFDQDSMQLCWLVMTCIYFDQHQVRLCICPCLFFIDLPTNVILHRIAPFSSCRTKRLLHSTEWIVVWTVIPAKQNLVQTARLIIIFAGVVF